MGELEKRIVSRDLQPRHGRRRALLSAPILGLAVWVTSGCSESSPSPSSSTSTSQPPDEGAICRSGSTLDIFDDSGRVDPTRYRAVAAAFATAPAVGFRFGHDATHYHSTPESFATVWAPEDHEFSHGENQPKSTWQVGGPYQAEPGGYNTTAGQVLYIPDDPAAPGLDAIQFIEVSNQVVSEKPQLCWTGYGAGSPDQSTQKDEVIAGHGGPLTAAVAIARPMTTDIFTQDAVVAFQDGFLLTTGTHASGGNSNVFTQLPANLVPTAVALTTNSEIALVTVWDTEEVRGGIAVVALGGPETPGFWGDWNQMYPGLHSGGLFGFIKVLGVVWIPGMTAPIALSAAADIRWPMIGAPSPSTLDLADEATRQRFAAGGDLQVRKAAAGFAVVLSRSEKKVAFVDLEPIFKMINDSYFGSRAAFDEARMFGQAPDQWPYSFDVDPEARPVVVSVVDFDACPTAVATTVNVFRPVNYVEPNDDRHKYVSESFGAHALIGTEDGTIHVFDVGGLRDDSAADAAAIQEVSSVVVGKNPTSIVPLGLSDQAFGYPVDYAVVSRGDRRIDLLRGDKDSSALTPWKTLRDSRLVDPISVADVTWFGNHVPLIEVADHAGKQVVGYRYDDITLHFFQGLTIGMGPSGTDPFECGGVYPTAGAPLFTSNTNVP